MWKAAKQEEGKQQTSRADQTGNAPELLAGAPSGGRGDPHCGVSPYLTDTCVRGLSPAPPLTCCVTENMWITLCGLHTVSPFTIQYELHRIVVWVNEKMPLRPSKCLPRYVLGFTSELFSTSFAVG